MLTRGFPPHSQGQRVVFGTHCEGRSFPLLTPPSTSREKSPQNLFLICRKAAGPHSEECLFRISCSTRVLVLPHPRKTENLFSDRTCLNIRFPSRESALFSYRIRLVPRAIDHQGLCLAESCIARCGDAPIRIWGFRLSRGHLG
jgi:hypothetical protein